MEQRLSIITVGVKDLAQSRAFYEALGWQISTEKEAQDIVAFNLQSFVFALYPLKNIADELGYEVKSAHPTFTFAYNVHSKDEVDNIIHEAQAIGAKIIKSPQKVFWGGYSGYFSDPDGYLWEVAYNPYSQPSKDGSFQWQ